MNSSSKINSFRFFLFLFSLLIIGLYGCGEARVVSNTSDALIQNQNTLGTLKATTVDYNAQANQLFDQFFDEQVALSPEYQTYLGIKDNQDQWDDISDKMAERRLRLQKRQLAALRQFPKEKLTGITQTSYAMAIRELEEDIASFAYRYHNYPVNQMFGTHSSMPDLLINAHQITNDNDAQAYIARVNRVDKKMAQLIKQLKSREQRGIIPPKFVFAHVISASNNLLSGSPFTSGKKSTLSADFEKKVDALDIDESIKIKLKQQLDPALIDSFQPAYESLIAYLTRLEKKAKNNDGIWSKPQGLEFYQFALKRTTTTDLSADEIHRLGLEKVNKVHDEIRAIMRKVNFKGSLQEFFAFTLEDPQFFYPNTEEGRNAYLARTDQVMSAMAARLDDLFLTKPKAELDVKRVEAFREATAGMAFYQRPAPDGSRPGRYYVNLVDMSEMPKHSLEALAYHEGLPGHHMQLAIAQELEGLPKFRRFGGYTAYIEGWGLYSEKLPKEFGFYQDPYSDYGRLAMELWRAARLVTDTGVHAKRWSYDKAIQYLIDNTPSSKVKATKAIERYLVMPSQATAYYIGMQEILDLRVKAKAQLVDRFDIREFHDVVLRSGAVPLDILSANVDEYISLKKDRESLSR